MNRLRTLLLLLVAAVALTATAQRTPIYGQRSTLFAELPVDSTTIVFLGNSITHGCEWHELLGMANVVNRGISGDTADGIDERLGYILEGQPAKIFLMVGVNDVSHDLTADSIARSVIALVDRIQAESPRTRVYLQSLLPVNNSFNRYKKLIGKEQTIRDINTLLVGMAAERGVTYVDLHPLFANDEGNLRPELTNDGLHLLGSGYLVWRDAILPYVKE